MESNDSNQNGDHTFNNACSCVCLSLLYKFIGQIRVWLKLDTLLEDLPTFVQLSHRFK